MNTSTTVTTSRILGIIGGMGPEATAELFLRIIRATPAARDQEHLRVLIDSNPQIPDRTEAILSGDAEPVVAALTQVAQGLERAGAQVLAAPCNTAHHFLPHVRPTVSAPILDMIAEACDDIAAAGHRRVGLLATTGTVRTGLYAAALGQKGVGLITPDAAQQEETMAVIHAIKADGPTPAIRDRAAALVEHLCAHGAEAVVAGCTELSLVLTGSGTAQAGQPPVPVFDPMDSLVRAVLRECRPPGDADTRHGA